jgi:hypothetical protein
VVVLDLEATPLLARPAPRAQSTEEKMFVLSIMGYHGTVAATYVSARLAHERTP